MAKDEDLVAFSRPDADEIIRKVLGSNFVGLGQNVTADDTSLVIAYTTEGATARSGTTLGIGTCSLRYLEYSGTTRTIVTSPDTYTFYNLAATAVGSNKYIMLLRHGSIWLCVWEEC
jgi:hypothetical protein